MLNVVLTYRLSRKKTWESYWRALLNDDTSHIANAESYAAAGMWKLLPCTTPSKAKEGPWTYNPQTGRLRIAFWDGEDPVAKTAVRLFGVHWNFRVIYSHTPCTGKGDSEVRPIGDQDIVWVMGPAVPVGMKQVTPIHGETSHGPEEPAQCDPDKASGRSSVRIYESGWWHCEFPGAPRPAPWPLHPLEGEQPPVSGAQTIDSWSTLMSHANWTPGNIATRGDVSGILSAITRCEQRREKRGDPRLLIDFWW